MAERVLQELGGPAGASQKLSGGNFFTLTLLASLRLDKRRQEIFIFGREWLE